MARTIIALLIVMLMSSCVFAGGIETISLVDVQGQAEASLLVGASDAQKAEYFPNGKMPSQILAFFVRTGEGEILFDTGLRDGHIVSELAKNGVKAEDVKTILLTHLHPDHFGGLVDSEGKAAFPNAQVYVGKVERAYWVDEVKNQNVIDALKLYPVHLFDFGDEVVPGVKAIDTVGHTPGHVSFLVEDSGEKLLVLGDIMHFPEIQLPAPEVAVRYDVDPVKAVQSRKFILDYASMKNIPIAGMHVTVPGVWNIRKLGEGYEKY